MVSSSKYHLELWPAWKTTVSSQDAHRRLALRGDPCLPVYICVRAHNFCSAERVGRAGAQCSVHVGKVECKEWAVDCYHLSRKTLRAVHTTLLLLAAGDQAPCRGCQVQYPGSLCPWQSQSRLRASACRPIETDQGDMLTRACATATAAGTANLGTARGTHGRGLLLATDNSGSGASMIA